MSAMRPFFRQTTEATPQLAEKTSNRIEQLIDTLVTPKQSIRFEPMKVYGVLLLAIMAWIGFLFTFTLAHHDQMITRSGSTYRIKWFDPASSGIATVLPFLLPGAVLFTITLLMEEQSRFRLQAQTIATILRLQDDLLTPIKVLDWVPATASVTQRFGSLTMRGWRLPSRVHLLRPSALIVLLVSISCAAFLSLIVNISNLPPPSLPFDVMTFVAYFAFILGINIYFLYLALHATRAAVDAQGITLPSPILRQVPITIAWDGIHAIYTVQTRHTHWLLVTDDAIYGWSQSLASWGLGGMELAKAVVAHTKLPVRDATDLCVAAVGKVPATPAIGTRWGELFAQTPTAPNRQSLRFGLRTAFVLLGIGLALGIAASWAISQFA